MPTESIGPDGRLLRGYTTKEVADLFRVSPATVRRWVTERRVPTAPRIRVGFREQRLFTDQWIDEARDALGLHTLEAPSLYSGPFSLLTVDADLGPASAADVSAFVSRVDLLFQIFYAVGEARIRRSTPPLYVAHLSLASPIHFAAAAEGAGKAAEAAQKAAGAIETVATLGPRRKIAKVEARVAEKTESARVALERAAARKAIAESKTAEYESDLAYENVRQARIANLRDALDLAKELGDPELTADVRGAIRELFNRGVPPFAVDAAARQAVLIADQARAIEASATEVPESEH